MYYTLTNFYQNHRDYYLSRDENQLKGNLFNKNNNKEKSKAPSSACCPLAYGNFYAFKYLYLCNRFNSMNIRKRYLNTLNSIYYTDKDGKIIYPCGLMANSMFTDVIEMFYHPADDGLVSGHSNVKNLYQRKKTENESKIYRPKVMEVPLRKTGIAWQSDRWDKYENPPQFWNSKHPVWLNYTKPKGIT